MRRTYTGGRKWKMNILIHLFNISTTTYLPSLLQLEPVKDQYSRFILFYWTWLKGKGAGFATDLSFSFLSLTVNTQTPYSFSFTPFYLVSPHMKELKAAIGLTPSSA